MKTTFTLGKSVLLLALFLLVGAYSMAQNSNETTGQSSSKSLVTNKSNVPSTTNHRRSVRRVMAGENTNVTVTNITPSAHAIDVPVDQVISVTFSSDVDYNYSDDNWSSPLSNALAHGMITLQLNGVDIACNMTTPDERTAILTPTSSLLQNTTYDIVIDSANISNQAWGHFMGDDHYSFTTINTLTKLDTTALTLNALSKQKVDFSWDMVAGSTGYSVSIYNAGTLLSTSTINNPSTTASSFNLNTAATDQHYTIEILALGDQIIKSNSDVSTLSFDATPLDCVSGIRRRLTSTAINLLWTGVTEAHSYTIIINDDILNPLTTTNTRYIINGLTPSTFYTLHIVANSDSIGKINSDDYTYTFTTEDPDVKTWHAGSGTCPTVTTSTYLPAPTPTPPAHWDFFGWSKTEIDITTTEPQLISDSYTGGGSEDFYAVYKSIGTSTYYATNTEINVSLVVNDSTTILTTNSALYTDDLEDYVQSFSNMVFKGWVNVFIGTSGQTIEPPYITFPVVMSTTLYAVYYNSTLNKYYTTIPSLKYNVLSDQNISAVTEPYTKLIVKAGNTLTIDQETNVLSIDVEQGAVLNLPNADLCHTATLTLAGNDRSTAQLDMVEDETLHVTHGINYKLNLPDNTRFYYFSLPYACDKNAIVLKDKNGQIDPTIECTIYEHNSQAFANGSSDEDVVWAEVTGTLSANTGYILCSNQDFQAVSATFPSTMNSYRYQEKAVAVTTHIGAADVTDHNWNFIGSSYLSNTGENCTFSLTHLPGVNSPVFVSQPDYNNNCRTYIQTKASEATILPFSAFFVQVGAAGNAWFTDPSQPISVKASETNELKLSLATSQNSDQINHEDNLYLQIDNQYTTDYEIGSDLTKMLGYSTKPQFYSMTNSNKLIYNSLPESAMHAIALGFYTGTTEKYTITAVNGYTFNASHIYLTDLVTNITTDLTYAPYQFEGKAGESNNDRFVLNIVRQETPTDMDQNEESALDLYTQDHQIILNHLTAGSQLDIIDATGKVITHQTVTNSSLQFPATSGMYLVRITQANGQTTSYKTLLK